MGRKGGQEGTWALMSVSCPHQVGEMRGLAPPSPLWGPNCPCCHLEDHAKGVVMLLILHNHHPPSGERFQPIHRLHDASLKSGDMHKGDKG